MNQILPNKRQRFLACSTYIGIIGLLTYLLCRLDQDRFIIKHARNSTIIFLTTILAYPIFTLISKYYFYYLSSQLGLVLIITYIVLLYLKLNGIRKAFLGQQI